MKTSQNARSEGKSLRADGLHTPNPTGRHGKPIVVPPTTFEDAVKKMLNIPAPPAEDMKPKKKQTAKKR